MTSASVSAPGTAARVLHDAVASHRGPALRFHDGQAWASLSYPELRERALGVARGLVALGIEPGERVAILSNTRPEWTIADLAIQWAGAIVVPVYQTNSAGEVEHVLRDSGARAVFVEDAEQLAKVDAVPARLPELTHVVAFTDARAAALELSDLTDRGGSVPEGEIERRIAALAADDDATIVYTSGTTGAPKGVRLTQGNLRANIDMVEQRIVFGDPPNTIYLWLPLAHVLARIVQFLTLHQGAELGYWRGDPKQLLDDVDALQPTHLPSVPRIFEKIHTVATSGADGSRVRSLLLDWAIRVGRRRQRAVESGGPVGRALSVQHRLADRLVLRRIRAPFGDRLKFAVTGAAPVDPEILRFFHAAGVYVLEGYGMTETTAVASVNTIAEYRFGTVGKPLPGSEVRIADDEEILIRGPHVFAGYFGDHESGIDADGWLHTGDLGRLDADGYLVITGRKKDIIITSSGKNVTPASIENALKQNRWISQAVVYGDRRPYLTALITLDPAEVPALAAKVGARDDDVAALASDARVRAEVQQAVDAVNARFARIEQVKRFAILERDLLEEEGELTPTAKVKRQVVYDRYGDRFDELYREA